MPEVTHILYLQSKSSSKTEEDETPVPQCPSDDILGIDAMLADLDSDKEENKESSDDENIMVQGEGIPEQDESESVEVYFFNHANKSAY